MLHAALAPRTLTGRGFRRATMPRKTTKPAKPVILTPEQIEAQARRETRANEYQSAREALISEAHVLAEKMRPGRVHRFVKYGENFSVMFGAVDGPRGSVEVNVELGPWGRLPDSDEFRPVAIEVSLRTCSLNGDIDGAEAQGRARIDAAAFARTLTALLA